MSFLEKLKGKSHNVLDKEDNSNYVISKTSSHHNVHHLEHSGIFHRTNFSYFLSCSEKQL